MQPSGRRNLLLLLIKKAQTWICCCCTWNWSCISQEEFIDLSPNCPDHFAASASLDHMKTRARSRLQVQSQEDILYSGISLLGVGLLLQHQNLGVCDVLGSCRVGTFVTGGRWSVCRRFDLEVRINHVLRRSCCWSTCI